MNKSYSGYNTYNSSFDFNNTSNYSYGLNSSLGYMINDRNRHENFEKEYNRKLKIGAEGRSRLNKSYGRAVNSDTSGDMILFGTRSLFSNKNKNQKIGNSYMFSDKRRNKRMEFSDSPVARFEKKWSFD